MEIVLTLLTALCIIFGFMSLHFALKADGYKNQAEAYKKQADLFEELLTSSRKMMENDTKLLNTLIQDHYPDIELKTTKE